MNSICIVSDEEAERIIKLGTGKEIDVDITKTFANLFTEQAKRTPDAPAVVDRDSQLTYGEMDRYSNALAHQLIDFGVQPNDFVCVMLDRKKEFPLSVLSIHKAGAAYTPLDFEYPNERLSYMLENSESKDCTIFHPNNTHRQFLSDVLIGFAKAGIVLKRVESEEFQQALDRMMDNPDLITLLRPLMAYNLGGNRNVRSIESTNDYTTQVLYRCGFQWPPTAADYVHCKKRPISVQ